MTEASNDAPDSIVEWLDRVTGERRRTALAEARLAYPRAARPMSFFDPFRAAISALPGVGETLLPARATLPFYDSTSDSTSRYQESSIL